MSTIIDYAKQVMKQFKEDNIPLLGAAQAYYYLLSVFPLLIVAFSVIPYFNISGTEAIEFIHKVLPNEIASILEDNIISLVETPKGGLLIIGIVGALWSASNAMNAFIKASNEAYEVEETRHFLFVRSIALLLTLGLIISLVIAILLPIFGTLIVDFLKSFFGISASLAFGLNILRWVIAIVVITFILILLYRFAPNKKMPIRHIIPGALTASILWQLISLGFSFYVGNFGNYSATYGSLGGIIILMIWFFLTGMILMIGAEINAIHHKRQILDKV